MKVLLNDYGGYAFAVDLSAALTRRGHRVTHVYTSASGSPQGDLIDVPMLTFIDIPIGTNRKADLRRRRQAERRYGRRVARVIGAQRPQAVIAANTPLDALRPIFRACRRRHIPFVLWWQDILSLAIESILAQRFGAPGRWLGRWYRRFEKQVLRRADAVIAVSPDFIETAASWGVPTQRMTVIPNWAPIDKLPVLPKDNAFSRRYGLLDTLVVLYAGTLGMKQNPQTIADAAKYLADEKVCFLVISDGVGMPLLQREKALHRLHNLLLLPLQPFEWLPQILAAGDLHLVMLTSDAGRYCVPSKVWASFCAARPVLLSVPPENYAAKVTEEIQAGVVLPVGDSLKMAETIRKLAGDLDARRRCGENGRRYAEAHFDIDAIAARFDVVLRNAAEVKHLKKGGHAA